MRIGLLTYYRSDVPGQFFQALATLNILEKRYPGAHIEIVAIQHEKRGWRPSRRPNRFLPGIKRHLEFIQARRKWFSPKVKGPLAKEIPSSDLFSRLRGSPYDLLVVGSDTTLKIDHHYKETLPAYWLPPDIPGIKIMLSSSAEYTAVGDLSSHQRELLKASAGGFQFLGVRDKMTESLIRELAPDVASRLTKMPDPTFTFPISPRPSRTLERLRAKHQKKICLLNASETLFTRDLVLRLSRDFTIVANFCDEFDSVARLAPGPFEWIDLIAAADLVLTGSFHESIFAMKFGTPVVAMDSGNNRVNHQTGLSKTFCLMEEMGIPGHHINAFTHGNPALACETILATSEGGDLPKIKSTMEQAVFRYEEALSQGLPSF